MTSNDFNPEQIIEFAANIEQRGVKLYTAAANSIKQEAARNILLHLADQERKHEQMFRKLYEDIVSKHKAVPKDIDDEAAGYLSALVHADIFPAQDETFIEQIGSLKDVVRVAKQAEKDSILFYLELSRFQWDQESEQILERITQEEKKHLVQLQELSNLIDERDVYY